MITNRVTEWRERRRITKAHLARQINVSRSYLTRLESGQLQPSGGVMFRIAAYFGRSLEDIFSWANPPARPAAMEKLPDKSLVSPTAKAVASPVAQQSQKGK